MDFLYYWYFMKGLFFAIFPILGSSLYLRNFRDLLQFGKIVKISMFTVTGIKNALKFRIKANTKKNYMYMFKLRYYCIRFSWIYNFQTIHMKFWWIILSIWLYHILMKMTSFIINEPLTSNIFPKQLHSI